ncbi:MAG: alpha/beta fold hydrolase [Candidatus Aminicenantes bacterium]|nr:alpha/beta fold hydrolase [Candidatus Aminicenantes bacterium]
MSPTKAEESTNPFSRVLFVSGSLGLGHVTRDLAVARELRRKAQGIDIRWLAASPTTEMLAAAGETVVPEWREYRCETDMADSMGGAGHLNLTGYVYRALGQWVHNAGVIGRASRRGAFDLLVGDETYEVIVAKVLGLRTLPGLSFVMMYDFWGMDVSTKKVAERLGAWGLNFIWSRERGVTGREGNAALFIGEPEDIPDRRFGAFLPNRRRYAESHVIFLGYILTFDPASLPSKQALKADLGYGPGPLVLCTVGGTAVGRELLELCGRAYPSAAARLPGLRFVLVCGPRIDPAVIEAPAPAEVERRGMVPDLYRHLAAADLVVTQGGGTTTLELTALRVPFIFFPVKSQAEQEVTIAGRLARHGAGVRMSLEDTTPEQLAQEIIAHIGRDVVYPRVAFDGASRAADVILDRLERGQNLRRSEAQSMPFSEARRS